MINSTAAGMLGSAFNNYLALDPEAPEKLRAKGGMPEVTQESPIPASFPRKRESIWLGGGFPLSRE